MAAPTEKDWGNWQADVDQVHAHRMFFGKVLSEVESYFAANPVERADELLFMPALPFQYYVQAFANFLLSPSSKGHSDAASCYLRLILNKLSREPGAVVPILDSLLPSLNDVSDRQEYYNADPDIYGDFRTLRDQILQAREHERQHRR